MKETYLSECLEKFHELPEKIQDLIGGFESSLFVKKLEDTYSIPLSFAVILISIDELGLDDLPEYLNLKFKLDKNKGEEIADQLEENIFIPVANLIVENSGLNEVVTDEANKLGPITKMSLPDKKEFVFKTFTSDLVPALTAEPSKIKDFNIALFQIFDQDESSEDKLENLLYINQEKLSSHQIILDGKPASPSIANWLKDFIKKYGSGLFNEVTLAEYLSQSPNIKALKPEEKELVRKVLKLYRNLVFFPESMDGIVIDDWEILPVSDDEFKEVVEQKKVIETPVINERQKTIFDLQKNLTKYPATSLEYKAISQEINRLSHK